MSKGLKALAWTLFLVFGLTTAASATVTFPSQGGTGYGSTTPSNVGKFLQVASTSPFSYVFASPNGATTTITAGGATATGPSFTFSTSTGVNQWKITGSGSNVDFKIPSNVGFFTNDAGYLTSAITSLNDSTSSTQTFATGTDTNLQLTIGTSNGVHTFTPVWAGDLAFSRLTQGSALSVLGVSGNAIADVASIAAGSNNQVLRRNGTSIGFGAINLNSTNAVNNELGVINGGTATSATPGQDSLLWGNGTNYDLRRLIAGTNVTISTSTPGQATISASGGGGGSLSGSGTSSQVAYWTSSSSLSSNSRFTFDPAAGGNVSIAGGSADSAAGGGISIVSGDVNTGSGQGGALTLRSGTGGGDGGNGGPITIQGGGGFAGGIFSGVGADIFLIPGAGDVTDFNHQGHIYLQDSDTFNNAILDTSLLSNDRIFKFPNVAGTFAVSSTAPLVLSGGILSCPTCVTSTAAGITSLNGSTSSTQTFATNKAASDWGISTLNGVHTFNFISSSTWAKAANNLSDLQSTSTARTNLGLTDTATLASSTWFKVANNLSEGVSSTIRTNILGSGTGSQMFFGDGVFKTASTTNVTEGTNLYWTQPRFNAALNGTTTTGLPEGTNLYYTDTRARSALSGGTGISFSTSTGVITNSQPHVTSTIAAGGGTATGNAFAFATSGPALSILCGTSTCTWSLPTSTASQTGVLPGVDWNTFNNKQNALTLPLTIANGGTATSTYIRGVMVASGTTPLWTVPPGASNTALFSSSTGPDGVAFRQVTQADVSGLTTADSPTFASGTFSNFTAGSVLFSGTSGALKQNNSNFFWDNANTRLGIGTSAPARVLDILGNSTGNYKMLIKNTGSGVNAFTTMGIENGTSTFAFFLMGTGNSGYSGANSIFFDMASNFDMGFGTNDTVRLLIKANGHLDYKGTAPTPSACGVSPSVTGNDMRGTVSVGTGVVTACTLTFAAQWVNNPICVVSDNSAAISAAVTAVSTSSVTFGTSATLGGGVIYYHCDGTE